MYFVISVLPSSITSGTLPPASVASNFWRWVFHCWYSTLTLTPGCCASKVLLAAATTFGHPDCASTCSQTVMLSALVFFAAPSVAAVTAAAVTATRQRATMMRLFIWKPPESRGPVAHRAPRRGRARGQLRSVGKYRTPLRRGSCTSGLEMSIPLRERSRPVVYLACERLAQPVLPTAAEWPAVESLVTLAGTAA